MFRVKKISEICLKEEVIPGTKIITTESDYWEIRVLIDCGDEVYDMSYFNKVGKDLFKKAGIPISNIGSIDVDDYPWGTYIVFEFKGTYSKAASIAKKLAKVRLVDDSRITLDGPCRKDNKQLIPTDDFSSYYFK